MKQNYSNSTVPGIYGSNRPSPRALPEDEVCLLTVIKPWDLCGHCLRLTNSHKSLATSAITIYPTWLVFCCCYCKHIYTCTSVYSKQGV